MTTTTSFEDLVAEGAAVPVEGWDFSWFDGRATEQRPSWGYARLLGERMATATAALDLQTGGGEVLAEIPQPPPRLVVTEAWQPNVELAVRNLAPLRATVVPVAEDAELPFPDGSFDLVVSRHPVVTDWSEVTRVLTPGGTYFSQQVGAASVHELTAAMLGPREPSMARDPKRVAEAADAAGLRVRDLRDEWLRMEFFDIAAVVYFLRKVIWIVPGFSIERYRAEPAQVHDRIVDEGKFVAHSRRFLLDAHKPV